LRVLILGGMMKRTFPLTLLCLLSFTIIPCILLLLVGSTFYTDMPHSSQSVFYLTAAFAYLAVTIAYWRMQRWGVIALICIIAGLLAYHPHDRVFMDYSYAFLIAFIAAGIVYYKRMTGWPNAGGDEEEQSAAEPAPLEMIQNPVPAGFWVRGGAYFIDIAFYTAAGFLFLVPVAQGKHTTTSSLFSALFAVVLNIALTASGGQTLGKFLAGIEVRTADGRDVGVVRSAVRYFSTWLDYITLLVGFIIAAFTGRKRSLHDYIAGTVVVYRGRPSIMRQLCMCVISVACIIMPFAIGGSLVSFVRARAAAQRAASQPAHGLGLNPQLIPVGQTQTQTQTQNQSGVLPNSSGTVPPKPSGALPQN